MSANEQENQAERLERALASSAEPSSDMASLVALARMLESLPQPEIDLSFADRLEARLMTTASAEAPALGPADVPAPTAAIVHLDARRHRLRRTMAVAIAAAFVIALPIAASASASPGSALYNVRLAREDARVWLHCRAGATQCGFAHLDRAAARLRDLRMVIAMGRDEQVMPTAARLHADLTGGARSILSARPTRSVLRVLERRVNETSNALASLLQAAPAASQGTLASIVASGDSIVHTVKVALGEPETSIPPAVAIRPPAVEGQRPPQAAAPHDGRSHSNAKQPQRTTKNSFGPGGTVSIGKPHDDETWTSDPAVADRCPFAVIGAPAVPQACGVVKGPGS